MMSCKLLKRLALCFAMGVLALNSSAQLRSNLKHYSTEDGLSHDRVLCMTKDSQGFMWFGTWDGINRFDGHNFIAYKGRPGDSSNLKNNKIRNIIEDKLGYLWVKTYDNEVYRFDKRTEKFLSIPDAVAPKQFGKVVIDKIIPASNGDAWLTTTKQGLICVSGDRSLSKPKLQQYSKNSSGDYKTCGNTINFLFEDNSNRIWVGTTTGLYCLVKDGSSYRKVKLNGWDYFGTNYNFTCITQHSGNIYIGTSNGTLVVYSADKKNISGKVITNGSAINALCFSKSNVLYASTAGNGLAFIDPDNLNVTYKAIGLKDTYYSLFEDKAGLLWVEPDKKGVIKYDPKNNSFKLYTQKVDSNIAGPHTNYAVFNSANNTVWVSMRGGGFGYYDAVKDDMAYFYDEPGSPNQQFSNIITAIYTDATGVLWLSGYDGGLYRAIFQPDNFTHQLLVKNPKNKTENEVRAIYEDNNGNLWIGSKAGKLYVYKNGKELTDVFINMPAGGLGSVYTITQGKSGVVWIGTKGSGLFKAEPTPGSGKYRLVHYNTNPGNINSLNNNKIYSVLEDSYGRVWVGTFGGGINLMVKGPGDNATFKNSNNAFKNYPIAECNVVRHLQEDGHGNIWVATTNGLVIFNPNVDQPEKYRFYRYQKIPGDSTSLGNNDVQYIYKGRDRKMWVGTFGGGLQRLVSSNNLNEKNKFKYFTTKDGLSNDIVLSIVGDDKGALWLTTENGLSKYDPQSNVFKNYDYSDGLPNTKFSEAAAIKSRSGKILLGCLNGYVSFDPDKVFNSKYNANIALTNIQLSNKNVVPGADGSPLKYPADQTDKITLNYDQNLIGIDYTVLDYRESHKILYAYKMDNLDKDWNYVRNQRQATYTNLSPGKYVFRVKSVSYDLFNNVPEKTIAITILPPPWLTWWAYVGYFILAIILLEIARRIIFTMIRLRNRVVVEQKLTELKLQFFTNISHELKTPLTLIVSPLEEITRAENLSPKGREYINVVNKNANRMIRFINQLLDFRKAQSGKMRLKVSEVEIVALVKHISEYFTELAHEKNIELIVRSNVDELHAWIDEEKLDIVIYNLLSNAFKFTPANKKIILEVERSNQDESFCINVIDQGVGVPKDKLSDIFELYYEGDKAEGNNLKGTGIGLALSKELIMAHEGKITVANNLDEGTTFTLELKTGKEHFDGKEVDFVSTSHVPEFIQSFYVDQPETEMGLDQHAQPNGHTVLIVEDNTDLRRFLCNQLSVLYKVIEAADGVEGLKVANDSLPDLIISDVMMPNMDGIQMLDQLKNDIVTSHIPVILLTAKSSIDNQIEGLKYGADFYITKPFHTDFILACVESLIKQRKQLFESILGRKSIVHLSPGEVFITSKDEQLLKETIRIVEEGMIDPEFNIDDVAVAIGLGRTTFYKKLKSLTGLAPVEFVRDIRLQRGEQLLVAGEYNISEIAYKIGFSSSGYFSTCFKEKYSLTPSQYLKKERDVNVHPDLH